MILHKTRGDKIFDVCNVILMILPVKSTANFDCITVSPHLMLLFHLKFVKNTRVVKSPLIRFFC